MHHSDIPWSPLYGTYTLCNTLSHCMFSPTQPACAVLFSDEEDEEEGVRAGATMDNPDRDYSYDEVCR